MWWNDINDMSADKVINNNVSMDDPNITWDDLRYMLTMKYGQPYSGGWTRLVFKTKTGVVKLDYPSHVGCNEREFDMQSWEDLPTPRMRLKMVAGFPLLFMEWVDEIPWTTDLPDWVRLIDGGQVGYTKSGRLVPFDII